MTPLGRSLYLPLSQVINWALDHHDAVKQARVTFDATA
jgi:DNA-binding HxlR family transcriptional regulator